MRRKISSILQNTKPVQWSILYAIRSTIPTTCSVVQRAKFSVYACEGPTEECSRICSAVFAAFVRLNNDTSSLHRLRISFRLNNEPSKPHSFYICLLFCILEVILGARNVSYKYHIRAEWTSNSHHNESCCQQANDCCWPWWPNEKFMTQSHFPWGAYRKSNRKPIENAKPQKSDP